MLHIDKEYCTSNDEEKLSNTRLHGYFYSKYLYSIDYRYNTYHNHFYTSYNILYCALVTLNYRFIVNKKERIISNSFHLITTFNVLHAIVKM